jgi:DNA-binding SARP family transcriptional activator
MYRLRLFGGATLEGPDGPLAGRVSQRRQLALLAFLSLRADRPTPRDRLLALFWPESDTERARHNLADSVYLIRRALGEECLLSMGDDLLLSPDHVRCDVVEFEGLLERGEPEEAVELYAGPFLDAFHLAGSLEFEHWLEARREELARTYLEALENLAVRAEEAGDSLAAVVWWRRASAVEPHNSRLVMGLMRVLAAVGDRAGAVRCAETHALLLEEEFEIEPDPSVAALAEELREGRPAAGPSNGAGLEREEPGSPPGGISPDPGSRSSRKGNSSQPPVDRRPGVLVGFALGIVVLFLAAALYLGGNGTDPLPFAGREGLDPDAVVIVPFRTAGAGAELEYLGQGMMELLAAKLSGDGGLRALEPGFVLASWWESGAPNGQEPNRPEALDLARASGAGNLITGAVVGTPSSVSLRASLVDTRTGRTIAEASVEGPGAAIHELVDRLVAQLLVRRAGEGEHRLAHLTSASLPALTAFLHAREAHRKGHYEEALRHYGRALDLDSTFALAGVGINQVSGWVGGTAALQSRGVNVALRHLDRLSERDRSALQGRLAPRPPGQVPSAVERIQEAEEALRRWPDHPVLWYRLGDELLHFGGPLELPSWERRAREAFQRAVELDPTYAEPVHHLAVLLGEMGDTVALRELVEEQLARTPTGPTADHLRWRALHDLGEASPVRPPPLQAMDTDATLRWIGIEAQDYGFAIEEGLRAVELRLDRPGIRDEHFERRRGAFAYALNRGRPGEALAHLESIREVQPDPHFHLRIRLLTALYADGDEEAATEAARELANARDATTAQVDLAELDLCVLAQWRLAREVEDAAAAQVDLPPLVPAAETGPYASRRVLCSAVVHAQREALLTGSSDGPATEHLEALLSVGRHFALVDDGHTEFAHLALARLHEAAGNREAALRALRRRTLYLGWQPYLARLLREEGRLAAELGDPEGALRAWEHYLAFRTDPEPPLHEEVQEIRSEVRRLTS